jgi:formate hydrogenlyase transcriptional activator
MLPQAQPELTYERLRLLLEINNAVVTTLDLHELMHTISEALRAVVPHDFTGLSIYDEETKELRVHATDTGEQRRVISEGTPLAMDGTFGGLAIKTRQAVLRHHIDLEEFHAPIIRQSYETGGLRSACAVPLMLQERILGAVVLCGKTEGAFSEEHARLLEQVAGQIAIAVDNALNFQNAQRERDRRQLLLEVSNAVVSNLTLKELLLAVSGWLRKFFAHDWASMVIRDEESGQLRVHALNAPAPGGVLGEGSILPLEGTPPGLAMATRQTVMRDRIDFKEFYSPTIREAYNAGLRSGCSVPLISHDQVLGTINVGSLSEAAFTRRDAELLEQIADQVAIAVENALNFQRAERERDHNQLLLDVSNAVTSHLDIRDLLGATSACVKRVIPHDVAALALYDDDARVLRVHTLNAPWGEPYADEGFVMTLEDSPAGRAATTRQPVLIHKLDPAEYASPIVARAYNAGLRSSCNVPLIAHDRLLGVVAVASRQESAFRQGDVKLLCHIAGQLAIAVENSLAFRELAQLKNKLVSEKLYLEEEIQTEYNFEEIIGQSASLKKILQQVKTVAPTDSAVLLCGETGTGKELIARAIHSSSNRRERTLVKLNCAAIPTGLLESELFGHEKGAFTGAIAQRIGRFELANKGTLLLDEVGEIPLDLQPKLLRVLQEHEFERLGSSRTIRTDARMIAATNVDLPQMVAEKKFRSDLFYRLNVFPITIPPLRDRIDDIPLLIGYFTQKHALRMNKRVDKIPKETVDALCSYPWPGNVRELENFMERSVILSSGVELQAPLGELKATTTVSFSGAIPETPQAKPAAGPRSLEDVERQHIQEILEQTRGVIGGKGGAAEILGLPTSTLRNRMKKLGLK